MKVRTYIVVGLFFGLPLLASLPAHASEGGAHAQVSGPWITLGDVAQASGPLAKVRVAPSPAPGETLALDPDFVARIAKDNGVYFDPDRSAPIRVTRAGASATRTSSVLPKRPSSNHILVLTSDINRGDILTADHLAWDKPDNGVVPSAGVPQTMADVIGQEAKRRLVADRAIRSSDIKPASVIRKGEPVTLIYAKGGLKLTVTGRALADAAMGEPVRIMNNYSKRALDAVASGAGEARIAQF